MNGALTYAVVAIHQADMRAAAERSRRVPRQPRTLRPRLSRPRAFARRLGPAR